jgi:cytochrome c oxidase subunit IV
MHIYDRDGHKHRQAEDGKLLFSAGWVCAVIFILAGLSALADYFGK